MIHYGKNDYERQYVDGQSATSLHAEVCCIRKIKKMRKKYRLLVLKFNKDGSLVESKPCSDCKKQMMEKGFTEVFYSTSEGIIEKTKLRDLKTRESKSQKQFKVHGFRKY